MCCGRYYDDAMMQAEAQGWADAFNKRRPPKEVQFLTGAAARGIAAITAMRCRLLPPLPRRCITAFTTIFAATSH